MAGLRGEGYCGVGSPVLLPLQLPDEAGRIGGLEPTSRETKTFPDQFELSGEHVLLLEELAQHIVVLTEAGDVGDDAEVVKGVGGVTELLEVGGPTDEHVVEPRGEANRDVPSYRRGEDRLAVGTLPRLFVAGEAVDAGRVASVEANETGADEVAVLMDVEAGDEVVVVPDIALGRGVPPFGDLPEVFFEVGDDIFEAGNLGGVLGGAGLDGERETVDELAKLRGGYVGVCVESSEDRTGRQWGGVHDGGPGWRRWERGRRGRGRGLCGQVNGAGGHGSLD